LHGPETVSIFVRKVNVDFYSA